MILAKGYIALNRRVQNNYAFMDVETGIHLSISKPMAEVTSVSSAIVRGIKGGTLIDLRKNINIEKRIIEELKVEASVKAPAQPAQSTTQEPQKQVTPAAPVEQKTEAFPTTQKESADTKKSDAKQETKETASADKTAKTDKK